MSITFYESTNARQERAARAQIKGRAQAELNAAEWRRRATVAAMNDRSSQAFDLLEQARLELRPYGLD